MAQLRKPSGRSYVPFQTSFLPHYLRAMPAEVDTTRPWPSPQCDHKTDQRVLAFPISSSVANNCVGIFSLHSITYLCVEFPEESAGKQQGHGLHRLTARPTSKPSEFWKMHPHASIILHVCSFSLSIPSPQPPPVAFNDTQVHIKNKV